VARGVQNQANQGRRLKLEWDYTEVADAYRKRPPYSEALLDDLVRQLGDRPGMRVCDIGAGTGNLTVPLALRGFQVSAVEPNAAMRRIGQERTAAFPWVVWHSSRAEDTGLPSLHFDLVTFGSSFNVVERRQALRESWRILRDGGWLACLWNFRDLNDPLQQRIEQLIHSFLPGYRYGTRREDQGPFIEAGHLFRLVETLEHEHMQTVQPADWLEAWRSHATLRHQAGDCFDAILEAIEALLPDGAAGPMEVGYITRTWLAQRVNRV